MNNIDGLKKYTEELKNSKEGSQKLLRKIGVLDKNNKLTKWGVGVIYAMNIPNKYNNKK